MRRTIFLFYSCCIAVNLTAQPQKSVQINLEDGSSIRMLGSSNVNNFECVLSGPLKPQKILVEHKHEHGDVELLGARIPLEVTHFDCQNAGITRDLQSALNAKEYPFIYLEVLSLTNVSGSAYYDPHKKSIARIKVTLAQKSKIYTIPYRVENNHGSMQFIILAELLMSDFEIEPPTALFGLVKVKDIIEIHANLVLSYSSDK